MSVALHLGDCREVMRGMADCSVDAIVTDPPYEIGFMGHGWDASRIAFDRDVWVEALRVLKPGGHVVAYGAARTYHWLACAVELAGFEIRDMVPWLQGQGMPHGLDVSKAIDKMAGAEREVVGPDPEQKRRNKTTSKFSGVYGSIVDAPSCPLTAPATPEAAQWAGWNTQLAPGHEPCVLARKPISEPTVAANVLRWGTGGLNVDGCRLGGKPWGDPSAKPGRRPAGFHNVGASSGESVPNGTPHEAGRWPPNVTLSEAAASRLDAMVGKLAARGNKAPETGAATGRVAFGEYGVATRKNPERGAPSGPSEFFYTAKAATGERENGCEHLRWTRDGGGFRPWAEGDELLVDSKGRPIGNPHPTVKPLALMRWLVRLVTPPGGTVFDPFMGSGTTGAAAVCEGFNFVGSDLTPWAFTIAEARIRWAQGHGPALDEIEAAGAPVQGALFT